MDLLRAAIAAPRERGLRTVKLECKMVGAWLSRAVGLTAAFVAAGLTAGAQAADALRAGPSTRPLPAFVWSGFYAGLNAGASWAAASRARYTGDAATLAAVAAGTRPGSHTLNGRGFAGGAQAGFNQQIDMLVAGVETDFQYLSARQASQSAVPGAIAAQARSSQPYLGTVRARLGITPADRLLIFATGGLAYGDARVRASSVDAATGAAWQGGKSELKSGWTLGAGAELAISQNVTFKGEYLYYDLGDTRAIQSPLAGPAAGAPALKAESRGNLLRAGLNYKF